MSLTRWEIICADVLTGLGRLPDKSIQCCVTSPPYWSLRDYGVQGQIGNEPTLEEHLTVMVKVFREVYRVLRDDGTLWLNYGDCYVGPNHKMHGKEAARYASRGAKDANKLAKAKCCMLPNKNLIGIAWRMAFALQTDGWILRSDIVFHKPNAMPDSAPDRPGRCHEYMFLLAKQRRYCYDREAVKEPVTGNTHSRGNGRNPKHSKYRGSFYDPPGGRRKHHGLYKVPHTLKMRNLRDVWSINTFAYPDAHFATFPPALVEPCILAGCPVGGLVLDPFLGSGTTTCVALEHGRRCVGIELNWKYVKLAVKRIFDSERKRMENNSEKGQ